MDRNKEITKELEIIKINGLRFGNHSTYCETRGFAFHHKELGFLSFKEDHKDNDVKVPYIPIGGRKALQFILDGGGLIHYDNIEWLHPINH